MQFLAPHPPVLRDGQFSLRSIGNFSSAKFMTNGFGSLQQRGGAAVTARTIVCSKNTNQSQPARLHSRINPPMSSKLLLQKQKLIHQKNCRCHQLTLENE
ncbi:hypothetical protein LB505_007854 [Fusarium chuoi]|nr:hypothetical protein LB505_007854 [Fusarium chuoi]